MKRKKQAKKKRHVNYAIVLDLLYNSVLFCHALTKHDGASFFEIHNESLHLWKDYYPSSISRKIEKLERKGLVRINETDKGTVVEITEDGKIQHLRYKLDSMSIEEQIPWDRKWRMVFFDISSTQDTRIRYKLLNILKAIGFYQMQKSVYVHPFPCRKQIQYIREVLNVPHSVKFAVVEHVENDEDLRNHFQIN